MDGVIEMFARNAFVLAGGVPLQWGLHGGPALCPSSCMFLFQDEYGLGFEAAVAPHTASPHRQEPSAWEAGTVSDDALVSPTASEVV